LTPWWGLGTLLVDMPPTTGSHSGPTPPHRIVQEVREGVRWSHPLSGKFDTSWSIWCLIFEGEGDPGQPLQAKVNTSEPVDASIRSEMAGVELSHPIEAAMRTQEETEALVEHLEIVLRRLACGNYDPPGSCCACLQDVDPRGHLPSCPIHLALIAIGEWRE
jgi:hypothetical protein